MPTGNETISIKYSNYAVYSFVLGLLALLLVLSGFVTLFFAAVYPSLAGKNPDLYLGYASISYLVGAVSLPISAIGLALGILGLRNKKHLFSFLGIGLNSLTVLGLLIWLISLFLI